MLDTQRRELRRCGILRALEPQVFALLEYLIRNRDRVSTKEEILAAIWHGRIVSEAALSTRINAARKAIGDDGITQRLIRTLRRQGIRFVAAVAEAPDPRVGRAAGGSFHADSSFPLSSDPSLAVLPFALANGDKAQMGLLDEIAADVIQRLSRLHWLRVVAASLSLAYRNRPVDVRQAGRELRARYVLSGSARFFAGRLRIDLELVDASTGYVTKRDAYERRAGSGGGPNGEIADDVAVAIEACLYTSEMLRAHRRRAKDLDAWDCVVRSIALINTRTRRDWTAARALLTKAIRTDAGYAQGYSLLSYVTTLGVAAGWLRRKDALDTAFDATRRALALDPDDSWAHVSHGFALAWAGRIDDAIRSYEQSLERNPRFSYAHTLLGAAWCYLGRGREAMDELCKAQNHREIDLFTRGNIGVNKNTAAIAHLVARQYRDGVRLGNASLLESPALPTTHRILIVNHALSGDLEQAAHSLRTLKRLVPSTSLASIIEWLPFVRAEEHQKITEAFRLVGLK